MNITIHNATLENHPDRVDIKINEGLIEMISSRPISDRKSVV